MGNGTLHGIIITRIISGPKLILDNISNIRETQQQQPQQKLQQHQSAARQFRSQVSAPAGYNNIDQYQPQQQQQSFNYNYKELMQQQQQVTYSQPSIKKSRGGRQGAGPGESAFTPFSVQGPLPTSQGEQRRSGRREKVFFILKN